MASYRLSLQMLSAFGTPLAGDTLFGQVCWTLRDLYGENRLKALLDGYLEQNPFLVISDAFPTGYVPLPTLPSAYWATTSLVERKALKKKQWFPTAQLPVTLTYWQSLACSDAEILDLTLRPAGVIDRRCGAGSTNQVMSINASQPHNTINRMTGTTGKDGFAPYTVDQLWYHPDVRHDLYVVLDESRLSLEELSAALAYIGTTGYGRDASIGLGKFRLATSPIRINGASTAGDNAWLTLGAVAPQGQGFCSQNSFYQTMTRFGRHGSSAALSGQPFKRPVLLARAGAVFSSLAPFDPAIAFIGQGIGGISHVQADAVQQGYAPVMPICLPSNQQGQKL